MKNATVRELIEKLSKLNQDAIVCQWIDGNDPDSDEEHYSALEMCMEREDVKYSDFNGNTVVGNIVALF